ncbi:MAG: glycosyltransferase family 4 protein [Ardenticatenaceae bacterium]
MRIGINALFQASGGSLTNMIQVIEEWETMGAFDDHEFVLFSSTFTQQRLKQELTPRLLKRVKNITSDSKNLISRLYFEQIDLLRQISRYNIDVLYCPANIMPLAIDVPSVVLFQNAAPFCPSVTRQSVGLRMWLRLRVLGLFVRLSAQRASRVIFISEYFRDLFVRQFVFPIEKGVVIYRAQSRIGHQGNQNRQIEQGYRIKRPYILTVAHLNPYKNILQLIEGFVLACRQRKIKDMQLVIAGHQYHMGYYEQIRALINRLGVSEGEVNLIGGIPHQNVVNLLANCEIYAFSSTCENCPTALIEALSVGVPIACSNVGVMPEIGGDAVQYFNPYDVKDIASVLGELMTNSNLRDQLRIKAIGQADRFPNATEVARQTLLTIEQAYQENNNSILSSQ